MTKETGSRIFLDSSIWLDYFLRKSVTTRELIESEKNLLFTSIISIHEIIKRLRKLGRVVETKKAIEFIENSSAITGINKEIAIQSVENSEKYGLHTIDSLIYKTAMETNSLFITADNDFEKTPNTKIIKLE